MIKNIIFDFGRVIVDFDETKMTRTYIKDESLVPLVRDTVFDRLYWDRSDIGTITDEELKAGVASRLPSELVPLAHAVYDNWIANVDLVVGIEEAIAAARENGVRFIACDMAMGVMGITREELIDIDDVAGVATFAELAKHSGATLFI